MTVMQIITPNADFAELASDERIARTLAALGPRGITAEVVETGAAARARVLELLPLGAEVFTSLSETLAETGLAAEINESGRYNAIRPKLAKLDRTTQRREMKKLAAAPDFVVGSVAAITEDGQVMVASGSGSQIGHYTYEAGKVILVAGVQKIVRDATGRLPLPRRAPSPGGYTSLRAAERTPATRDLDTKPYSRRTTTLTF